MYSVCYSDTRTVIGARAQTHAHARTHTQTHNLTVLRLLFNCVTQDNEAEIAVQTVTAIWKRNKMFFVYNSSTSLPVSIVRY